MLEPGAIERLANAIRAVDTDELAESLERLIRNATNYESVLFMAFFLEGGTRPLYNNLSDDDSKMTVDPYLEHAYILDPWYNMFREGVPDGVYRLSDCAPDDFATTEYYQEYYMNIGLEDECAIFARVSDQTGVVMSFGTRVKAQMRPGGLRALSFALPCIQALCARQWKGVTLDHDGARASLEDMCLKRGLSRREIEVTTLLLRGFSNKLIARDLGVSPETVKIYRKRINKKLGTSSSREVFASFFDFNKEGNFLE